LGGGESSHTAQGVGEEERKLVVDKAAEEELTAAVSWYEARRPGLGQDFLAAVDATCELMRRFPKIGSLKRQNAPRKEVRRLGVEGFPFSIMYREFPEGIYVVAVAHDKRRPGYWKNR
jgi:plasmid stabilization system protein ParE